MFIALIIIGLLWAGLLSFFGITTLTDASGALFAASNVPGQTPLIHMGHYAWETGKALGLFAKSIWLLVAALPGYIILFTSIIGLLNHDHLKHLEKKIDALSVAKK